MIAIPISESATPLTTNVSKWGFGQSPRLSRRADPPASKRKIPVETRGFDGEEGFAEKLEQRASSVPGVTWLGPLPHSRIPGLLGEHHVLVLPSLWPENSPIIVREAAAAGLGVICSSEGDAAELAPWAVAVRPGDTGELGEALLSLTGPEGRRRQKPPESQDMEQHAGQLIARYVSAKGSRDG